MIHLFVTKVVIKYLFFGKSVLKSIFFGQSKVFLSDINFSSLLFVKFNNVGLVCEVRLVLRRSLLFVYFLGKKNQKE